MIFTIVVVITIVSLIGCVCIKKPVVRIGLGIIVALGLMLTVLIGSFTYTTRYRVNSVDSSISQDGKYELLFQQIGDPDWPFGFTHARLVLKDELGTIAKYSFDVRNDGASVHSDSWQVNWKEDCVEAVISGEEQNDEQEPNPQLEANYKFANDDEFVEFYFYIPYKKREQKTVLFQNTLLYPQNRT